jgi:hypothetical protein
MFETDKTIYKDGIRSSLLLTRGREMVSTAERWRNGIEPLKFVPDRIIYGLDEMVADVEPMAALPADWLSTYEIPSHAYPTCHFVTCHRLDTSNLSDRFALCVAVSYLHFWSEAVSLVASGRRDAALDKIYDGVDNLMRQGSVDRLDALMGLMDPKTTDLDLAIGLLSASIPVRDKLNGRAILLSKVEQVLLQRGEDPSSELIGL